MNPLARLWAERRLKALERQELCRLVSEVRDRQRDLAPLRESAAKRRREAMRQDGPTGFVMVHTKEPKA